jgi:DNA-binding SARP family transcriptional activator
MASPTTLHRQTSNSGSRVELDLQLLGGFELRLGGEVISLPASVERLVAYLALHDRPVHRLRVAGTLWIDASEEHANASLRTALWRLRGLSRSVVAVSATHVVLSDAVSVDVRETAARAARILAGGGLRAGDLARLSAARELLADWYDDWIVVERERVRQLVMRALERMSADARAAGRLAEAAEAGLAAVACEPLRESAHRLVVQAHLEDGNAGEAIRQYRLFSALLKRSLGLDPSPRMLELMEDLPVRDDLVT